MDGVARGNKVSSAGEWTCFGGMVGIALRILAIAIANSAAIAFLAKASEPLLDGQTNYLEQGFLSSQHFAEAFRVWVVPT